MAEARLRVSLPVSGPYSLAQSAAFLEGFSPAGHGGATDAGHLHLAFPVEGSWGAVGACVQSVGDEIVAAFHGDDDVDLTVARSQLMRVLSLDVDGRGFPAVADRDPVIARLQAAMPGLRPVCFFSPYEAAVWSVLSHRVRMTQAAAVKRRIAQAHGTRIDVHGDPVAAFPSPYVLGTAVDGLEVGEVKRDRIAGLAEAASDGRLDADRLRAMDSQAALDQLQELPGIGPFSAELVLLRGAGHPDCAPRHEKRLIQAVGELYGITDPTAADLSDVAEAWQPYRTWCAVLIRAWFERRG